MYYILIIAFTFMLLMFLNALEKTLTDREFMFLFKAISFMFVVLMLTACGKDGLKKLEYNIDGEWKHCSQVGNSACGLDLRCGDEVYYCMDNVQVRSR